jgi:hypothetical protein
MIQLILHTLASVALTYSFLSLIEYLIHRHVMHRPKLAQLFNSTVLFGAFVDHAIVHHKKCYAIFDRESDSCALKNLTVKLSTAFSVIVLPCIAIFAFDRLTSFVVMCGALAHGRAWSAVHSEMHRPRDVWFAKNRLFSYLKWRHYLHHRHPGTNFNALFPMWDWVLGTAAAESEEDRIELVAGTWRVRAPRTGPPSHAGEQSCVRSGIWSIPVDNALQLDGR